MPSSRVPEVPEDEEETPAHRLQPRVIGSSFTQVVEPFSPLPGPMRSPKLSTPFGKKYSVRTPIHLPEIQFAIREAPTRLSTHTQKASIKHSTMLSRNPKTREVTPLRQSPGRRSPIRSSKQADLIFDNVVNFPGKYRRHSPFLPTAPRLTISLKLSPMNKCKPVSSLHTEDDYLASVLTR